MDQTLGFITQRELDCVVGQKRRRERMEGKLLPRGERVKSWGQAPIIFPEFAAAALVVEHPTDEDRIYLSYLHEAARGLYGTVQFSVVSKRLRSVVWGRKDWTLTDLAGALVDEPAFQVWRRQVGEAMEALSEQGIVIQVELCRIEDVTQRHYLIRLHDTSLVSCALNASRSRLSTGMWVTRELVELGARKGEILLPTVAPDVLRSDLQDDCDDDEREWEELTRGIEFQPVVPRSVEPNDSSLETPGGDLVRPARRLTVRANRELYTNANTMTRRERPGPA